MTVVVQISAAAELVVLVAVAAAAAVVAVAAVLHYAYVEALVEVMNEDEALVLFDGVAVHLDAVLVCDCVLGHHATLMPRD